MVETTSRKIQNIKMKIFIFGNSKEKSIKVYLYSAYLQVFAILDKIIVESTKPTVHCCLLGLFPLKLGHLKMSIFYVKIPFLH